MASKVPLLFAWDLGANWGHVMPLLAVLPALHAQGFALHAAVNNVRQFGHRLTGAGVSVLQAPLTEPRGHARLKPVSLAHVFHNRGLGNVQESLGVIEAWRSLMHLSDARLALVDGSPHALIAARSLAIPVVNMSLPFHAPPAGAPLPVVPDNLAGRSERSSEATEAEIYAVLVQLCEHYQLASPQHFADLFNHDEGGLFCWPELDPYGHRPGQHYWGPLIGESTGDSFVWPQGNGPRIFAYLRADAPMSVTLLMVLGRLGCPVVAAFPGWGQLPVGDRKRIESPTLLVHEGPLSMAQATQEAQRAVGNGGLGFTHAMLAAGRPLALLPHDVEKALTTRRVIAANAGISLDGCNDALALEHRLREWLHDSQTLTSAMQLAEKYAQASPADLPVRFAQRCYSLLKSVAV